jgi:predicted RNA-binding Zn-ribbon protein involved in translation (DUF1610 family)
MKAEILEIITQHKFDHISSEQAVSELLNLFAVSGSASSRIPIDDEIPKCPKCGSVDIIILRVNKCLDCKHQWP